MSAHCSLPVRTLYHNFDIFVYNLAGDTDFVQKNCQENAFTNPDGMGILSTNPLTNIKYHFVVTVAMIISIFISQI